MTKIKNEIISSSCVFGAGKETVHVLVEDCPIQRVEGRREVTELFGVNKGEKRQECTCTDSSFFTGVSRCQYYKGTKEVKVDRRTKWRVSCTAETD